MNDRVARGRLREVRERDGEDQHPDIVCVPAVPTSVIDRAWATAAASSLKALDTAAAVR